MPPLASVVVVNWNGRELLRACLESLSRQTFRDFEVIVVDNGSEDGSREMLRREWMPRGDIPCHLIANSNNRGFCTANNQGFALARGRFIALLNNDAEAEPGWLGAMLRAFEGRPEFGMAAPKVLIWEDPSRIDKVGHLIYPDGQNRGRGTGETDRGQFDRVEELLWPDGCAAMYRKAMLDGIGGFDDDFFMFGDDAELGMRARIAGWKCISVPDAIVRHHHASSMKPLETRRVVLIERNRVWLAAKLFPWRLLLLNPYYYAVRLAYGVYAGLRNRGDVARFAGPGEKLRLAFAMLRGDFEALLLLPKMLRKRGDIARISKLTPRQIVQLIERHRISLREMLEQAH